MVVLLFVDGGVLQSLHVLFTHKTRKLLPNIVYEESVTRGSIQWDTLLSFFAFFHLFSLVLVDQAHMSEAKKRRIRPEHTRAAASKKKVHIVGIFSLKV